MTAGAHVRQSCYRATFALLFPDDPILRSHWTADQVTVCPVRGYREVIIGQASVDEVVVIRAQVAERRSRCPPLSFVSLLSRAKGIVFPYLRLVSSMVPCCVLLTAAARGAFFAPALVQEVPMERLICELSDMSLIFSHLQGAYHTFCASASWDCFLPQSRASVTPPCPYSTQHEMFHSPRSWPPDSSSYAYSYHPPVCHP